MPLPKSRAGSIVWTGSNEYEVHQLIAGDYFHCWWDEGLQAYRVRDGDREGLAYPGDRIVPTPSGFRVETALDA